MAQTIILREHQSLFKSGGDGDYLISEREWKEIRDYVRSNPAPENQWVMEVHARTLKAKNYVGVIQTRSGTTIEILPKVDLGAGQTEKNEREIFLRMLRRLRDSPCRNLNDADIKTVKHFPLLEAFITMFLQDMHELTRRGLACAYNEVEENRHYLKGKLLIAQHLRHNLVHKERFYVRYEEFSVNRPINRLLKSTLLLLQRLSRNESNRSLIRQALFYFEDIPQSPSIDTDLIRARVDRTMPLYNRLFPWACLFLKRASPTMWKGGSPALALLFPMERVFEDYVAYRVRMVAPHWEISTQEKRYSLIERNPKNESEFRLCPDIVARCGEKTWVMDTKWKHLNPGNQNSPYNISQSDLYQLYAYGKKYELREGATPHLYLLYPCDKGFKKRIEFEYETGLHLTAFPINPAVEEDLVKKEPDEETLQSLFEANAASANCDKAA